MTQRGSYSPKHVAYAICDCVEFEPRFLANAVGRQHGESWRLESIQSLSEAQGRSAQCDGREQQQDGDLAREFVQISAA